MSKNLITKHFSPINDPRIDRRKKHELTDIFFMTLCAVICGADNWVMIEGFCKAKEDWFTDFLGLENGIPSHDTLGKVFAAIDTQHFSECFANWIRDLIDLSDGQVIPIASILRVLFAMLLSIEILPTQYSQKTHSKHHKLYQQSHYNL